MTFSPTIIVDILPTDIYPIRAYIAPVHCRGCLKFVLTNFQTIRMRCISSTYYISARGKHLYLIISYLSFVNLYILICFFLALFLHVSKYIATKPYISFPVQFLVCLHFFFPCHLNVLNLSVLFLSFQSASYICHEHLFLFIYIFALINSL